jgi:hypothetical protein
VPNPNIPQGGLNRLIASVNWPSTPNLSVTAPYLGKNGIHFALEGEAVEYIPTMTGAVTSPEPYMMFTMTIELLKSQAFSDQWKQQLETNAQLGDGTVWPDSTTLSPFALSNTSITGVRDLPFNGQDAVFAVTVKGYYQVNADLWG